MSGIAGLFYRDGQPIDANLLVRMTDVIAHRGPDRVGHWISGPVGLGHCMLHTTPESLKEQQPLTDQTGNLCLVLDGRVDNREELIAQLEAKGSVLRSDSDAEIVLCAYSVWGDECPKHIIGDFAFALWDGYKQQLFCARDYLGLKPFYYFWDNDRFIFGSEPQQIFQDPSVPQLPNEGMIGEYLASSIVHKEETLYQHLYRLAPAHSLTISATGVHKKRYWQFDLQREIRYRTNEEYAEHFKALFEQAVRCRLRSNGIVSAELSGGLDSSSVVSMVYFLCERGLFSRSDFKTYSLIFPGLDCDESPYIQSVVEKWNADSTTFQPKPVEKSYVLKQVKFYHDIPDYPNGLVTNQIRALIGSQNIRVLLTGYGGDQCLTGSRYVYADMIRRLDIAELVSRLYIDSNRGKYLFRSAFYKELLQAGVIPLLDPKLYAQLRRMTNRPERSVIPPWIHPKFAERINLTERIKNNGDEPAFASLAQREHYRMLTEGWTIHISEMEDRYTSRFGLEARHPFADRRLAEFCLTIPEEQRSQRNYSKFVLRRAMKGILPDLVRYRKSKADFSHTFPEVFQSCNSPNLFEAMQSDSKSWVIGAFIQDAYRSMMKQYAHKDSRFLQNMWWLWDVWGLELWLVNCLPNFK